MGIFDALTTAVAGLQAQSFALQNLSGDIANSQTLGYKGTNTSFEALVSGRPRPADHRRGDRGLGRRQHRARLDPEQRSRPTWPSMATGVSWWRSQRALPGDQPLFSAVSYYTRAGDFQMNQDGYLVNGAGYYLMGIPVDPQTGAPTGSSPQVLQFNNEFVPAQETTAIQYQANLPSSPSSGILNAADFEANPLAGAPVAAQITGTGATLQPDALATGTGTVGGLTLATALTDGDTYTVSDGTNTTSFTAGPTSTINDLISAINAGGAGSADVSASLVGGSLVLTGTTPTASITVGGTGASQIGFGAGDNSFEPVNLLTQSAVSAGQTLTVTVGGGSPQTDHVRHRSRSGCDAGGIADPD